MTDSLYSINILVHVKPCKKFNNKSVFMTSQPAPPRQREKRGKNYRVNLIGGIRFCWWLGEIIESVHRLMCGEYIVIS